MIEAVRIGVCLLVGGSLLVAGCSTTPPYYARPGRLLGGGAPATDLSCPTDEPNRCAQPSPILQLAGRAQASENHYAAMLEVGTEALEARIHLIRSATRSIDLQTYIWANDEAGQFILDELVAAARRGVVVRILSDQLRDGVTAEFLARLALTHVNLEKRIYNPFRGDAVMADIDYLWGTFFHFNVLNHRMHCKMLLVDGRVGIVGGRNVQNRYFDQDPDFDYIDRDVLVVGPTVKQMSASFEEYWESRIVAPLGQLSDVRDYLLREVAPLPLDPPSVAVKARFGALSERASDAVHIGQTFVDTAFKVERMAFTADRPMKPFVEDRTADLDTSSRLRNVVGSVKRSLLVQTPYPILSNSAYEALASIRARNKGIEFTLSTNSLVSSDHFFVYALAYKRKKRNVEVLDFNIHELKDKPADASLFIPSYAKLVQMRAEKTVDRPPFQFSVTGDGGFPSEGPGPRLSIHAKSLVVDNWISVIGSHNFDPRSRDINTENVVIIWDEDFANALAGRIRLAAEPRNSWLIAKKKKVPVIGRVSGLFGSISRVLPIFDLWPFRWTSSFALRDGKQAVRRSHDDFYQNYEDVGQFPSVNLDIEWLEVQLVSAFGAVSEPFM